MEDFLFLHGSEGIKIFDSQKDITLLKTILLLYADDTVIIAGSAADLQHSLDGLNLYCTAWNLKVNITKTKVVIFSKSSCKNKGTEFTYANKRVELVESFKYLGVLFKSNGKFHLARKALFEQASKAMFSVLTKTRTYNLNVDVQLKLFDTLVLPVLLYGCEIWGSGNIDLCEKLHLKFCRYVLNVKSSSPNYMIYGELERFPVMSSLYSRMIGFWANLVCGNSNKISFKLYQIVRGYLPENAWLNKIKTILQDVGLSNIWQSESVPSKKMVTMYC